MLRKHAPQTLLLLSQPEVRFQTDVDNGSQAPDACVRPFGELFKILLLLRWPLKERELRFKKKASRERLERGVSVSTERTE